MEVPASELGKILLNRVQKIEPQDAMRIVGYVLLTSNNQEAFGYAFGSDKQIQSVISEAKAFLASSSPKPTNLGPMPFHSERPILLQQMPFSPAISRPFSAPSSFRVPAPDLYWEPHLAAEQQQPAIQNLDLALPHYRNLIGDDCLIASQGEMLNMDEQINNLNTMGPDFPNNYYYPESEVGGVFGPRISMRSPTGLSESPMKACHYFYKGYCKHGVNCRYFHGQSPPDSLSQMYNLNANERAYDDRFFTPGSLEQLEMEIAELLKAKNGAPLSIAALPTLYLEKYGKVLQAEGYLTESQRHGKSGFSLTKLLARLRNNIRLIDRPHGQHAVILAEDAPKFTEYRNERSEMGPIAASSCQIYLTFPAESTFTEEDVLNYFKQYGPVRDVRIPHQDKRMFGFVSFLYSETVKLILSKGHPHYIRGSRVLVKPYKEKSRLVDRKYMEKIELPIYYPQYFEMDPDPNEMPRLFDNTRLLKKHLEEQELAIELERRRLFELQLTPKQHTQHTLFGHRMEDLKLSEDHVSYPPIVLNNGSSSDDKLRQINTNHIDQDSGPVELPDSPFAPQYGAALEQSY